MSFLLDTDTCAEFIRGAQPVPARFAQHLGRLHVSVVSVTELEMWLRLHTTPLRHQQVYITTLQLVQVLSVDDPIAHRAAQVGSTLLLQRRVVPVSDLLVIGTALIHGLTLVTRATPAAGYPGLTVV